MKVIAIDFDGTITHNTPYPQRADIREEAKKYIPLLYKQGYKLVLWTARTTKYYNEVISRLKEENLFQYFTFDDVVVVKENGEPIVRTLHVEFKANDKKVEASFKADGKEIIVNDGNTFIQILPSGQSLEIS